MHYHGLNPVISPLQGTTHRRNQQEIESQLNKKNPKSKTLTLPNQTKNELKSPSQDSSLTFREATAEAGGETGQSGVRVRRESEVRGRENKTNE